MPSLVALSRPRMTFKVHCSASKASSALPYSTSKAVGKLAKQSRPYAALLACQNKALDVLISNLDLVPASFKDPAVINGLNQAAKSVGAIVAAWEGGRVRWVSASALANADMQFGTTRLMAWTNAHLDCPHFVLELGLMTGKHGQSAQGTLTLAQRSDLVLDLPYLDKYYNNTPHKGNVSSYNDVFNRCLGHQNSFGWRHYQVPQADMKPVIANSISYTFPADVENISRFTSAAVDVARLWCGLLLAEPDKGAEWRREIVAAYDQRHRQVVMTDPGNMIAVKLFGQEATDTLLSMTIGE